MPGCCEYNPDAEITASEEGRRLRTSARQSFGGAIRSAQAATVERFAPGRPVGVERFDPVKLRVAYAALRETKNAGGSHSLADLRLLRGAESRYDSGSRGPNLDNFGHAQPMLDGCLCRRVGPMRRDFSCRNVGSS